METIGRSTGYEVVGDNQRESTVVCYNVKRVAGDIGIFIKSMTVIPPGRGKVTTNVIDNGKFWPMNKEGNPWNLTDDEELDDSIWQAVFGKPPKEVLEASEAAEAAGVELLPYIEGESSDEEDKEHEEENLSVKETDSDDLSSSDSESNDGSDFDGNNEYSEEEYEYSDEDEVDEDELKALVEDMGGDYDNLKALVEDMGDDYDELKIRTRGGRYTFPAS